MNQEDNFWPLKEDKLFLTTDDYENNACLSWPTLDRYADSFYIGARGLVEATWNEPCRVPMDAVIYPIVFMYRQYMELILKHMIHLLRCLEKNSYGYPNNHHNLKQLWDEAKPLLLQHYSPRFVPGIEGINSCISDFNAHDSNSFSFRFPYDKDGNPTLQGLRNINLRNLYETMERVNHFLDCMTNDLAMHLEYKLEAQRESQYS